MRTDIRNIETFEALRPNRINEYLRARGWTKSHDIGDRGEVWDFVDETGTSKQQVLLPIDQSLGDYGIRIGDLVRTVATTEDRGQTNSNSRAPSSVWTARKTRAPEPSA